MSLTTAQCADLVETTLAKFERLRYTDIATNYQEYIAMPMLMRKQRIMFRGGTSIDWKVRVALTGTARQTGLFAQDDLNVADVMIPATVPWTHTTADWAVERREINMNRGDAERIVDLIQERENDALTDLADHMEGQFFGKPTNSDDTLNSYGIRYWIKKDISGTSATPTATGDIQGGFNGLNPTGFSSGAAGVNSTTYPNWANWTFKHTSLSETGFIDPLRKAMDFCKFMAPVPTPELKYGEQRYGLYTVHIIKSTLEKLMRANNDNLGADLAWKDGQVVVRSTPVTWAPYLQADTDLPIFGVDWSKLKCCFLQGEYMTRSPAETAPNNHTVIKRHIDCTYNWVGYSRRCHFVGSRAAAYQN